MKRYATKEALGDDKESDDEEMEEMSEMGSVSDDDEAADHMET